MAMRNLDDYKQTLRTYGGLSCLKIGLTVDGKNYLVKFPGNLKDRNLKNIDLSYSNGPVCEHLGSMIFELCGVPVHKTQLATRDNKLVVMCEDFLTEGYTLSEFREMKATFEPAFLNRHGELTDGTGTDLDEALLVIRKHPLLSKNKDIENFFWKMFIVDAIIGNADRNNGNWGFLIYKYKTITLAPVYDNGNSLNNKWDDEKMNKFLQDEAMMLNEAYKAKTCFFSINDKKINPFQLIESSQFKECTQALSEILNVVSVHKICSLFEDAEFLTDVQKEFYKKLLSLRISKLHQIHDKLSVKNELKNLAQF